MAETFTKWLLKQYGEDSQIGDLAWDAYHDKTWPRKATTYREFFRFLYVDSACDGCFEGLKLAWAVYSGENAPEYDIYDDDFMSELADEELESRLSCHAKRERSKLTAKLRFEILQRDNFLCRLCGYGARDGRKIEVDHKNPVSRGGKTEPENLWTLCIDCNRGKNTQVLP